MHCQLPEKSVSSPTLEWLNGEDEAQTRVVEKSKPNLGKGRPLQLTTAGGNPVADSQNSINNGPRGPLLMQDYQFSDKLARQNLECVFEGNVRVAGSAACSTLTISNKIVPSPCPGAVKGKFLATRS